MRPLRIVLGIASVVFGVFCLIRPSLGVSFAGWAVTVLMILSGIAVIAGYVTAKTSGMKTEMFMGTGTLVLGIILLVFSVLALFLPGVQQVFDIFLLVMFTIGLIFKGFNMIATGVVMPGPGFLLIIPGVFLIIAGFNGIVSLFYAAITMGIFFGIGFLFFGASILCGDFHFSNLNNGEQ